MKLIQSDIDQLAPVVLARASYERRRLEAGSEGFFFFHSIHDLELQREVAS